MMRPHAKEEIAALYVVLGIQKSALKIMMIFINGLTSKEKNQTPIKWCGRKLILTIGEKSKWDITQGTN